MNNSPRCSAKREIWLIFCLWVVAAAAWAQADAPADSTDAYRLGAGGTTYRFSDDGEPGGSAGRPILQQIEGHDLTDVMVVVVRYYGGTKLGVGGLVRAYGAAAAAVMAVEMEATVETVVIPVKS